MTVLSAFHHKDSFKWIDYHFQSVVFNLNIFREWGRERIEMGERNKLNNNMISSWIIFISTWWKLWISSLSSIQFAEWYWGISLFSFWSIEMNHFFSIQPSFIFRAVNHFHLWSHHRHLKSRQMNRLFLSISYLQFISSWGRLKERESVRRV